MSIDRTRLESVNERVGGTLKTSRKGQPYLVVKLIDNQSLRIMYFERSRRYKIYRDHGLASSQTLAQCSTSRETIDVINSVKTEH